MPVKLLQWGRVTNDAEIENVTLCPVNYSLLQWGRVTNDAEIFLQIFGQFMVLRLQWGRVTNDAEIAAKAVATRLGRAASMGPRHE